MTKKRIWVLNNKAIDIQSVNQISQNLSKLYLSLPKDQFEVSEINLPELESRESVESDLKKRIVEFKKDAPDHVVIILHNITNHIFISALLSIKTVTAPQFIFHVFGNFIRYGENWFSLNYLLTKKNIQFIVSSKSYFKLLANFIPKQHLSILPYPINLPFKGKEELAVEKQDEVLNILYAGRYHEQKNVTQLILALNDISKDYKIKICLNLVVYFDDFNPTTIKSSKILGEQFANYTKVISDLSASFEINLLPHQKKEALNLQYSNNDVLISFSTFLDEEYGNAVIESLILGTPCIVSNWGGYKDFCDDFPEDCFRLNIILEREKLYLDIEKLSFHLETIAKRSSAQRDKLKKAAIKYIGQEKLRLNLINVFSKNSYFDHIDQKLLVFSNELKNKAGLEPLDNFKKYYKSFW